MRVANAISLGCSLLLPVDTVNCVQTLKALVMDGCRYTLVKVSAGRIGAGVAGRYDSV
jgi:hypothetical protein